MAHDHNFKEGSLVRIKPSWFVESDVPFSLDTLDPRSLDWQPDDHGIEWYKDEVGLVLEIGDFYQAELDEELGFDPGIVKFIRVLLPRGHGFFVADKLEDYVEVVK